MADRVESAADITVSIGEDNDITVERISLTKDIDIESVYGSGALYPDGYGINQVSFQGTIELNGNKLETSDKLFDDTGVPQEFTVTVSHYDGSSTVYTECLITSEGYEMSSGEVTTTSFDMIAHGKNRKGTGGGGDGSGLQLP